MKRIADILQIAIEDKGVLQAAKAQSVLAQWLEAVGETLAAKVRPDRYDHGVLWVIADGSAWANEVRLRSETICDRLNVLADDPGLFVSIKVGLKARRAE